MANILKNVLWSGNKCINWHLASVISLSYAFVFVELFIRKVEKTIQEAVTDREKLTISGRTHFLLICIYLKLLIMLWTVQNGTRDLAERTLKSVSIHFIHILCQIWKISSQEDRSEPQITVLKLWYTGNTYLYFERMQHKLWCMDLQWIKQGSKKLNLSPRRK